LEADAMQMNADGRDRSCGLFIYSPTAQTTFKA